MAAKTRVSLVEFLAMPETEPPSELIDGEVIQKMAPSWYHSVLTSELISLLRDYLRATREGSVTNELRHVVRQEERVFLPDISFLLANHIPRDPEMRRRGPIPIQPDFAIEVLSPDDQPGRLFERAAFYMRAGTSLLWFVDPDFETITAYRPDQSPTVHAAPATLDASPVLRDFHLDLAALFAILHEGE
jgi:Uma2 family endonuclease